MNREEAIRCLSVHSSTNGSGLCTDEQHYEAKQMAIKALEQEPCEDAISRQAVIDSLHSKFADGFDSDRWWNSMSVLYAINKVPPVNPTKTGHWIPVREKMPEDGQYVLFCDIDNDIMVGYHVKGRPDTHFSQDGTYEDMKNVRAWMHLPKPFNMSEIPTGSESEV